MKKGDIRYLKLVCTTDELKKCECGCGVAGQKFDILGGKAGMHVPQDEFNYLLTEGDISAETAPVKFQKGEEVYIRAEVVNSTPDHDGDIEVGVAFGRESVQTLIAYDRTVHVANDTVFRKEEIK